MKSRLKKKFISAAGPSITAKEVQYVARAARDGWHENHLKYVTLFERKLAAYVGRKYALATSSCTGALHLAYLALGLKKGDEVLVPNITWIATVEPLYYIGAKPIFLDIESDIWTLDPRKIEEKITRKTKAIVVVDLYGNIADMDPILRIARRHKLKVIEDAAEAIGSEYGGRKAGSFGDISCFSFHGSKTLVTGEGGMLLTNDRRLIEKARYYNDHCKDPKKVLWNLGIGYKYKMSNFQAACGLAQLSRIKELILKKRKILSWYREELGNIPGITLNAERPRTKNTYWMVTAVFDRRFSLTKEDLMRALSKRNIQARPFFYPLSSLPPIRRAARTPVAFDISSRAINLPSGYHIGRKDVHYISQSILSIIKHAKKISAY